jgi:serine/threonine-protein kinase
MEDGTQRARILDFGVCKLDTHDGEALTSTGEAVGTISYMAPEQIRGASKVDERADLYAFAMVVFEALSGRLAYEASGQIAMIASKLEKSARHLRDVASVPVPAGIDALLARCLSRKPADRVANASEMLRLWQAMGPANVEPLPLPVVTGGSVAYGPETVMTAGPVTRIEKRGTKIGLIIASVALVASSIVLIVALRSKGNAAPPPRAEETPPAVETAAASIEPAPPLTATPRPNAAPPVEDAGARPKSKTRPIPTGKPAAPKATATGPHISVEPRY